MGGATSRLVTWLAIPGIEERGSTSDSLLRGTKNRPPPVASSPTRERAGVSHPC